MSQAGVERIRQLMKIHSIVQGVLMALLLFVAWKLQQVYAEKGALKIFFNSIYLTLGLQVLFFYPIYRFAAQEAASELTAPKAKKALEQKALQRQRIVASLSKAAVFIFYGTMIASAPAGSFVSSTAFFSFFATTLTYLQCFNFAANKLLLAPKRR
ncbi:MAG: hypothetical protein IBX46_02825 [Desulfuromonadales bacterium]|nr:hypothetical protein [Desulfuromonadales bacterium]